MQRILLSVVAVLCFFASAHGQCVKVLGTAGQSQPVVTAGTSSTTKAFRTFPSSTITIYNTGTLTPATLWTNATCSVSKSNPMTADSSANYDFFILSGAQFDVKTSGTGVTTPFTRSGYTAPTTTSSGGSILRVAKLVVTPTYTVLAGDAGKQLVFNNTGAVAVTLAQAGTGSFTSGFWFDVSVVGGGTVTITPTTSTINNASTLAIQSGSGVSGISNDGTDWYGVAGGSTSVSGNCPTGVVCPDDYGAIHDGSSHLLSSRYSTLVEAQAAFNGAYAFVTSLSQQIDYAAVKAASNAAFGADQTAGAYITVGVGSTATVILDPGGVYPVNSLVGQTLFFRYYNGFVEQRTIASNTATTITLTVAVGTFPYACDGSGGVCLAACGQPPQTFDCIAYAIGTAGEHGYTNAYLNLPLYINSGNYLFGNDTWLIRNLSGGHIYGNNRTSTILTSNNTVFATDGLWYTHIEGIEFRSLTTGAVTAFDIDGNVPGHPYTTRGVQGNTFSDLLFDGGGSTYATTLCRQSGAAGQCSENNWLNDHWTDASVAAYYQLGANALHNVILGGDSQFYQKDGFYVEGGSIQVIGHAFENAYPSNIIDATQVLNGGFDIKTGIFGVAERIVVTGCRTESLQFYSGTGSQPTSLTGNNQIASGNTWTALTAYALKAVVIKSVTIAGQSYYRVFRITTAGTSGAVEPTWCSTDGCTNADGSAVWTQTTVHSVLVTGAGAIDMHNNSFLNQSVSSYVDPLTVPMTADETIDFALIAFAPPNMTVLVDASGGNRTLTLKNPPVGQTLIVKKAETSANTVTVAFAGTGIDNTSGSFVIPGSSRGSLTIQYSNQSGLGTTWWVANKTFGLDAATLNGATMAIPGAIGGTTPAAGTFTTLTGTTTAIGTGTGTSLAASSFLKVNNTGKLTLAPLTTQTYASTLTIDVTISNHVIAASNTTSAASTWTPSAAGSAGDLLFITTVADASGTVTVTFASTFHPSATQVTTLSHYSTICFISTGSVWVELYRTTNLA